MAKNKHWNRHSMYLENVSGHKITEEQEKINSDSDKYVVATQVFPTGNQVKRSGANTVHTGYDAFIYYSQKPVSEGKAKKKKDIKVPNELDIEIPE